MDRNNIELKWVAKTKLYSRSGDYIEFRCKPGYLEDPNSPSFRVQCVEGTLNYPQCTLGSKSSPLQLSCSVVAFLVLKGSSTFLLCLSWGSTWEEPGCERLLEAAGMEGQCHEVMAQHT